MLTKRSLFLTLLTPLLLTAGSAAALSAQPLADPCGIDPHREHLAAWVGEWRVVDGDGELLAKAGIKPVAGECAFEETLRRVDGSHEFGLIFLDRADSSWRQRWVSSLGHSALFEFSFHDDAVTVQGEVATADGNKSLMRGRIAALETGGFAQSVAISIDGGKSWTDGGETFFMPPGDSDNSLSKPTREKPKDLSPVTPKPPTKPTTTDPKPPTKSFPKLEPPTRDTDVGREGKVRVRSKRKSAAPVPETSMESPMTLEFELGPLADLPPGAGWRTKELAPYVADRVNITQVTAQRRQRRGKTEIELVVNLRTRAGQSKVDLEATLFTGRTDVASRSISGIKLGKLIKAHDPVMGMAQKLRLAVDAETFDSLFANGSRPSVRLTVTVH